MAISNWTRIAIKKKANELLLKSFEFAKIQNLTWVTQMETTLSELGMMESVIKRNDNGMKCMEAIWHIK